MKTLLLFIILLTASIMTIAQNNHTIEGNWVGSLDIGGKTLRLGLIVSKKTDGSLTAYLDSIDQGAHNLPIDTISQDNGTVKFEGKSLHMTFEGKINDAGSEIAGQLTQGSPLPFVFKRVAEIPKAEAPAETKKRPQDPVKPYPYDEEEVTYQNVKDNVKLAGTLTLPRTAGRHPAVLLITGSGAQDRDETILGHHPFLVLADYLTRRGIAVLRVDDRGVGGSSLGTPGATTENFAGDVLTGVEYLKTRKEVDPKKIGLIGHSEGGMIAPTVAVRSPDVAFIVLLAGPGQTGEEIIYEQNALSIKANVADPASADKMLATVKGMLDVLKSDVDEQGAIAQVKEVFTKQTEGLPQNERDAFLKAMQGQLPAMMSPWYRFFLAFNPRQTLEKVNIPVLALNGENDTQVPAKENLPLIKAALTAAGNKDFTVRSFPKLNHLFQTSTTGLVSEYGNIDETISPVVLETIGDWISGHTK